MSCLTSFLEHDKLSVKLIYIFIFVCARTCVYEEGGYFQMLFITIHRFLGKALFVDMLGKCIFKFKTKLSSDG